MTRNEWAALATEQLSEASLDAILPVDVHNPEIWWFDRRRHSVCMRLSRAGYMLFDVARFPCWQCEINLWPNQSQLLTLSRHMTTPYYLNLTVSAVPNSICFYHGETASYFALLNNLAQFTQLIAKT